MRGFRPGGSERGTPPPRDALPVCCWRKEKGKREEPPPSPAPSLRSRRDRAAAPPPSRRWLRVLVRPRWGRRPGTGARVGAGGRRPAGTRVGPGPEGRRAGHGSDSRPVSSCLGVPTRAGGWRGTRAGGRPGPRPRPAGPAASSQERPRACGGRGRLLPLFWPQKVDSPKAGTAGVCPRCTPGGRGEGTLPELSSGF